MIAGVADTHAALWYLFGDPRLSAPAREFIDNAAGTQRKIVVSVISLAEIVYLIEKNRLPFAAYERLRQALGIADYVIDEAPLTIGIIEAMRRIHRTEIPDMPDRVIAATALYFGAPVISRDHRIRTSKVQTVW